MSRLSLYNRILQKETDQRPKKGRKKGKVPREKTQTRTLLRKTLILKRDKSAKDSKLLELLAS